jgi:hypothetical protein
MIKKYFLLGLFVFSFISLWGCSLGGGTTPTVTTDERIRTIDDPQYDFTVRIPREWDVIERKDFAAEVPKETVIVFRNNIKNENFTANVSVLRHSLQKPQSTLDFAKLILNRQRTGLYNYKETRRDLVKTKIGGKEVDTYVTYFEAKKDPASPLARFIQTYVVKDNSAYIALGAFSPEENSNNVKTVEDIVKSFKLR